jgi:hypothetical protein
MSTPESDLKRGLSEELINEFLIDIAEAPVERSIAAAALFDPFVRRRLKECSRLDDSLISEYSNEPGDAAFEARALGLRERMADAARTMVRQNAEAAQWERERERQRAPSPAVAVAGVLKRVSDPAFAAITGLVKQTLVLGRHALTLPGLAPAAAAAPENLDMPRQTFTTPEGVRIEFQQLPGATNRVRAVVDASALPEREERCYNAAFLVLEESHPTGTPDRHVLVVSLNDQGRGFTDVLIGGEGAVSTLPTPESACHLVGATLSCVTSANAVRRGDAGDGPKPA